MMNPDPIRPVAWPLAARAVPGRYGVETTSLWVVILIATARPLREAGVMLDTSAAASTGQQTMVPVGLQKEGPGYLGNGWSFFIGVFDGNRGTDSHGSH